MDLPKVEGTQIRGTIYHLNLRIKPELQHLHDGKTHLRGSLRTSDPEVARREVERRRAELSVQEQQHARQAEVDDFVAKLSPEKRAAYEAAGGLEGLLEGFESRTGMQDSGSQDTGTQNTGTQNTGSKDDDRFGAPDERDTGGGTYPATAPAAGPIDDDWPLGSGALTIVPNEDDDYEDELPGFTIADLLDGYAPTLEPERAEAMRHIVRLFTEFHGPVAYDELGIEHLDEFAEAIRQLPADSMAKLSDGTYVRDLPFAEMVAWTVHADARPISETTRFQYVALLKELMLFGVPHYRKGDPWSEYRLQILRRESAETTVPKPSRRFSPSEWTLSDALLRLLEVAIVVFVVLVFILLWQNRT